MKVLKFGGTSLGSADSMRQVANILRNGNGKRIVVLSAMSGTTNTLNNIIQCLNSGHLTEALHLVDELEQHYLQTATNLLNANTLSIATKIIQKEFEILRDLSKTHSRYSNDLKILIRGELITCQLFQCYLKESNLPSKSIQALDFIKTDKDDRPDYFYIKEKLHNQLQYDAEVGIFLTQGYACINVYGEVSNLGRGGSDFTATIIGSVLNASVVEIWTDIDGLQNNDPRFVDNTMLINKLSFEEAEELAYFGAKILHPTCIKPIKLANIPVVLKNTFNPDSKGTLIYEKSEGKGIKAIAAKDNIIAINIKSGGMLNAIGFLRRVFEIFENYRCPVDMITTSEIAVSITIEEHSRLNSMIKELKRLGEVSVYPDQTIICLVGDLSNDSKGLIAKVSQSMDGIPLRMLSYGASKNNLCLLIDSINKKEALNHINQCIFSTPIYA